MAHNTTDLHLRLPPRSKRQLRRAIYRMEHERRRKALRGVMPKRTLLEIIKGWIGVRKSRIDAAADDVIARFPKTLQRLAD
jgi:hypothetical protein